MRAPQKVHGKLNLKDRFPTKFQRRLVFNLCTEINLDICNHSPGNRHLVCRIDPCVCLSFLLFFLFIFLLLFYFYCGKNI